MHGSGSNYLDRSTLEVQNIRVQSGHQARVSRKASIVGHSIPNSLVLKCTSELLGAFWVTLKHGMNRVRVSLLPSINERGLRLCPLNVIVPDQSGKLRHAALSLFVYSSSRFSVVFWSSLLNFESIHHSTIAAAVLLVVQLYHGHGHGHGHGKGYYNTLFARIFPRRRFPPYIQFSVKFSNTLYIISVWT